MIEPDFHKQNLRVQQFHVENKNQKMCEAVPKDVVNSAGPLHELDFEGTSFRDIRVQIGQFVVVSNSLYYSILFQRSVQENDFGCCENGHAFFVQDDEFVCVLRRKVGLLWGQVVCFLINLGPFGGHVFGVFSHQVLDLAEPEIALFLLRGVKKRGYLEYKDLLAELSASVI